MKNKQKEKILNEKTMEGRFRFGFSALLFDLANKKEVKLSDINEILIRQITFINSELDSIREETLGDVEANLHRKYLKRTKKGKPIFKTATEAQIIRQWDVPYKEGWNDAVNKFIKDLKTKGGE